MQFCRYLFYLGKIRTIQLEYTDAKESLLQAARKAPTAAVGFRIQCNKWVIIVRLLLGEIPERTIFMQKGMKAALAPYFELTNVSISSLLCPPSIPALPNATTLIVFMYIL
jgi:26S proteasome regulatory subunit N3